MGISTLQASLDELRAVLNQTHTPAKAIIGIDGFVDQIIHVVDKRKNAEEYTRIKTITQYGERILKAASLSTNMEAVPIQVKLGGNGPILSNALIEYGVDVTYLGALGVPEVHPVFREMVQKCEYLSIANPSHTDALEFEDGKIIVSQLESFKDITWENLKRQVGVEKLVALIQQSDLFCLQNWTMIPYMSQIWLGILTEVLPHVGDKRDGLMFFDLADPEKRDPDDIKQALELIAKFAREFKVTLGLNMKEACQVATILGLDKTEDIYSLTTSIGNKLDIYCVVVHAVAEAASYCDGEYSHTAGWYDPNPKLTTGAGDNFNAGFCLGQLFGLPSQLTLVLAAATSGFYVRNAKSPTLQEIMEFLDSWRASV